LIALQFHVFLSVLCLNEEDFWKGPEDAIFKEYIDYNQIGTDCTNTLQMLLRVINSVGSFQLIELNYPATSLPWSSVYNGKEKNSYLLKFTVFQAETF
jgi:hypothetical protein